MARDLCDRFEVVDLKDKEGLLAMARAIYGNKPAGWRLHRRHGFFVIGCMGGREDESPRGYPMPWHCALLDKSLMREAFRKAGAFPSPRFALPGTAKVIHRCCP